MYRAYVRVQKLTPGIFSIIAKYLVNICQGFFDEPFNTSLISLGCYKVPFQKNLSLSLHYPKGNPKYRDITLYVERKRDTTWNISCSISFSRYVSCYFSEFCITFGTVYEYEYHHSILSQPLHTSLCFSM